MPVLTQCRRSRVLVLLVALVWDGFGMTIHDGVFEFEAELKRDIVYWASLSPSVPVPAWTDACSSLVYNGRRGSLGRFYTKEENDRAYAVIDKYNLKCGMEPSDAAVEGRWVSSDGTIIWENGICAQQYCNWRPGAPDNLWQSGEASLLFQQSDLGKWNDITAGSVWQVLCEFRCTADADCNGSGDGDKWVCHATTGRCVKLNECSKYAVEQNEDGYAESEEYDDVAFWISKTAVRRPTAETTCKLMCRNGRPGRLARMVSEQEYQRVVALGKSASVDQAHVDGSDFGHEGVWKYSDGSIFYDDAADDGLQCKQERCFWGVDAPSSQAGEHYLEAKLNDNAAHWNDAKRDAAAKGYICEFPCYSDEECHETAGLEYMCHKHGRCVRKSQCSVYGAVSLSAGRLSSGKDIRFWYSGTDLQYKRADAQATCNALCVDGRYGRLLQVHSQAEDMAVKTLMGVSTDAVSNIGPKGLHMDGIDIMIVGVRKYKWSSGWWWYSGVCRQAFCNWAPGNPAHKLYIHQNANSQWVSTTPEEDTERPFVCEFACTSDDDCDVGYFCLLREGRCMLKTGGSCNNGMVAFTEGQAETTEYKDIRYWLSDESLYEYYARRYVCFLLCHDGKIGRVARVYSRDEMTRTQSLLAIQGVFRAGIDAIEQTEMTFVWADGGGVVWTKDGGCQQKFCDFSANEPNNGQQGIENNLEVIVSRGWNDNWGGRLSNALCEFPCVSDRDCESSGSDYTCHFTGRCVHHSNCNPESPVPLSDGTLEDTASADITFWHSKTLTHTTTEAQAVCSALCHNGRHGRLARITSADENTRVAKLSQSVQSHTDGVTDTAAWMWADDGHIFYVADSGCTGYCAWNLPPSRGSAGTLSTKSSWVVVAGGQQLPFTCEFPCVTDFDCIGSDEPCPVYECNVHGRCVLNPGCYRDGRCSSFKTEADCGAKGTCEWDQAVGAKGACVDEPCQYGDKAACGLDASCDWNEACGDAAAHECVPKRCAATASAACTADVRCRWSGSACAPAPCVEYPSEACCDASAGCEWSLASSPAYCKQTYCSGAHAAQTPCQADAQCAWHGGICVAFSCRLHAGAECECKAHDACLWDPVIKSCDSATFTACPALDVVVLLDGSAAMASGFGRHPHGNLALAEVLRDWVRALPLSGEKAGAAAPAVPSGFRVGFVQYAASEAFAAIGRATDYSNVGTKGRLSGDLAELEADLTWHEQNLVGGPSKIDKGLVVANGMFEASNQPRARILLAFACGGIQDSSSVAASLAPLDAKNVDRFGITLRRSSTQSLAEQAADTSLRAIASLPTADHTLSLPIAEVKSSVLFDMCDPAAQFGSIIVSKTTEPVQVGVHQACLHYTDSHGCTQDPGCAWRSVDQECVNSACVRLCTEADCAAETSHLCEWVGGWCFKQTVCAFTSQADCAASTQLCEWKSGACEKAPCVSVGTEQECTAESDDCSWWTINGIVGCIETPCTAASEAVCEQDTRCQFATDLCDVAAGPKCEVAGCSVYKLTGECDADPRCTWDATLCQMKPCGQYTAERCCDRVTECAWDTSTSPATCQLKMCYSIALQSACGQNPECMWSAGEDRCVDLDCGAYAEACPCANRDKCFWKNGMPAQCTLARYGMCPLMDVAVVFDGSTRSRDAYGRHPDGLIGVLEQLRAWAKGLPLSGEGYAVADAASPATGATRLSFLQFGTDSNGSASTATGNATAGALSGNWTELAEDLAWHGASSLGGDPMVADGLSRAAEKFEAGSPASSLRKRVLIIITAGDVDTSGSKPFLDELDILNVQRFGLLIQKSAAQSKLDITAENTLRTLTSAVQSHHTEGTSVDSMPSILDGICDPNANWGSQIVDETPGNAPGKAYPCELYRLNVACAKDPGCVWSDSSSLCVKSPCTEKCDNATCTSLPGTNCSWAGGVCINEPILDCHCKYDGADVAQNEDHCRQDDACTWNSTSSECMIDECRSGTEGTTTCGNHMQRCVDYSWVPCSNDWYCECIAPEVVTSHAQLGAAECSLNECDVESCGPDQVCKDLNESPDSRNNWECRCQPPYTGAGSAQAATCKIDECRHICPHCENGTCESYALVNQTCVDPDSSIRGDWECRCPFPTNISAVGGQAPDCDFDECTISAQTCLAAGQDCVDNIFVLDNWECQCKPPYIGAEEKAVADCYIDECVELCTHCANGACYSGVVNQTCFDPSPLVRNDWTCVCPGGVPSVIGKPAICEFDECVGLCPTCANATCTARNQSCRDPSRFSNTLNDWQCECPYPSNATSPTSEVPSCNRSECELHASTCTGADPPQDCYDPNESVAGDWYCECLLPFTGNQSAGAAACMLDECEASCDTCEEDACNAGPLNQTCEDPNQSAKALRDWTCSCPWTHASVNQSTTLLKAANCVFDECLANCSSCAEGACEARNQTCVDPNKRSYSLRDWMCECPSPSRAFNVSAPVTSCGHDECTEHAATCTQVGQDCVDPNHGAGGNDWMCHCRSPTTGFATATAADCIIDECGECDTCANGTCSSQYPVQACNDPDLRAEKRGDWTCSCPLPAVKHSIAKAAVCPLDECRQEPCGTCANDTCGGANQTCSDPNPTSSHVNDWICKCNPPSNVTMTGGAAAACGFDECDLYNSTCDAGQLCEDRDLSVAGNWWCTCVSPSEGEEEGRAASCHLDECTAACDSCENGECSTGPVLQRCTDPNPSSKSLNDWLCHCPAPSTVVAIRHVASCHFDECDHDCITCANDTCTSASQTCRDPVTSSSSLNDWTCHCMPPSSNSAEASAVVSCGFDECESHNKTCQLYNQSCWDSNQLTMDDWMCVCKPPLNGNASAFPAECSFDECADEKCDEYGQDCEDPNTSAKSLNDWICKCKPPSEGQAPMAKAACVINECEVKALCAHCQNGACERAGQDCFDPNTTAASVSDWICSCRLPSKGDSVLAAATCVLDECANPANEGLCATHSQTCHDPDQSATSTGDWECHCIVPPALNASHQKAEAAACEYSGECATDAEAQKCLSAGHLCYDPDVSPLSLHDWICMCASPLKGDNKTAKSDIACEMNECLEVCSTCASTPAQPVNVCEMADQTCLDPDHKSFDDWICECPAPAKATATASAVSLCLVDECAEVCPTCAGDECQKVDQACSDPNKNVDSLGDWTCTCNVGNGSSTGKAAECVCDECLTTTACSSNDQLCNDDGACPGNNNFECICRPPSVSSAVGQYVAQCETDECVKNSATCVAVGQTCEDGNLTQFGDWMCKCPPPSTGEAVRGTAQCELDECAILCPHCENDTCADAAVHQKCDDPDTSAASISDWTCNCAQGVGNATAGEAACVCDECAGNTVCGDANQTCIDTDHSCPPAHDFTCVCKPPSKGTGSAAKAVCLHDECEGNVHCSQHQTCRDPDLEEANDWTCGCDPPLTGEAGSQTPAACFIDECVGECSSCEDDVCTRAGQLCEDPDTNATSLEDWTCTCKVGEGKATTAAATCTCEECVSIGNAVCSAAGQKCIDVDTTCGGAAPDYECQCQGRWNGSNVGGAAVCEWDECSLNGTVCTSEGQACVDTELTTEDSWECVCPAPSQGKSMRAVAACVLDECEEVCASCENSACSNAGQECSDPDTGYQSTSDWTCTCVRGLGKDTAQAAACVCDECFIDDTLCPGQICADRNVTCHDGSAPDYTCACGEPFSGSAAAEAATCLLDECTLNGTACADGQTCNDTDHSSLSNWECGCPPPSHGFAVQGPADCTLNECNETCWHCENGTCSEVGQLCADPDDRSSAMLDWTCSCAEPRLGINSAAAAVCQCDECLLDNACAAANQTCIDENTACHDGSPSSADYTCYCKDGSSGSAVGEEAACERNECDHVSTCSEARQVCVDPSSTVLNDWYCECPNGTVGSAAAAGQVVAKCEVNECTAECETCAGTTCTAAEQSCHDEDTSMLSLRDWTCDCQPPSESKQSLGVADCRFDECSQNPCVPESCPSNELKCSQACKDLDTTTTSLGDFVCLCPAPSVDTARGQPALCVVEPCYHTSEQACLQDSEECMWTPSPAAHCEKVPCTVTEKEECLVDNRCGWGPVKPPGKYSEGISGVLLYAPGDKVGLFPTNACHGVSACAACSEAQPGLLVTIAAGFVEGHDGLSCELCEALGVEWNISGSGEGLIMKEAKGSVLVEALASVVFSSSSASSSKRSFSWVFGTDVPGNGAVAACVGSGGNSVDAYLAGCSVRKCLNDTQAACESDASCRWVGAPADDPCVVEHCAALTTERDCKADGDCVFDMSASPAVCKLKYCSGLLQGPACFAGGCAWDSQRQVCYEKDCSDHGEDRCACHADELCYWESAAARCVSERYGLCPVMDVVLLLPGTASMAGSFGLHLVGFYGLTEMVRDWLASVPLTGEDSSSEQGSTADAGGIRVGIAQFGGEASLTTPFGTGCSGSLSGDAGELAAEVSWHESQFPYVHTGAPRVIPGLQKAATVFSASPVGRKRVVVVVADKAFDAESGLATALTQLEQLQVVVFGAGLRKQRTASASDAAVTTSLGNIATTERVISGELDDFPDTLASLCDPSTLWGHELNPAAGVGAHGPCPHHADREACVTDPGCAYDGVAAQCRDSGCVKHCAEGLCAADAAGNCGWDTVAGETGCWEHGACAHGGNATACRSDPKCDLNEATGSCAVRPCTYTDELGCRLQNCVWNSDASECTPKTCVFDTEASCQADATCWWTPCGACAAKRCGADAQTEGACAEDPSCRWDSEARVCSLQACAGYSGDELCCTRAAGRCGWDVSRSPAICAAAACSEHDGSPGECRGDGQCRYDAAQSVCEKLACPSLDHCDCLAEETCAYRAKGAFCVGTAYGTCPALDLVIMIDGSHAMSQPFGRHPHGFVGLLEVLRAWIPGLPLYDGSGDGAAKLRVSIVQYAAGAEAKTAPGGGGLSGALAGIDGELAWHADNFYGSAGAAGVKEGLSVALSVFEEVGGAAAGREKALLVVGGALVSDSADVESERAALEARGVSIFAAFVGTPGAPPAAAAAGDSLRWLASEPKTGRFASVSLETLRANVLSGLCDPLSMFGAFIANETSEFIACPRLVSKRGCLGIASCDWVDAHAACVNSHCSLHCGEGLCKDDAVGDCRWVASDETCLRVLPDKTCEERSGNATECAGDPACEWQGQPLGCAYKRCDHETETGCLASRDEPCAWDSERGLCAPPACTFPAESACTAEPGCGWAAYPAAATGSAVPPLPTYTKGVPARPLAGLVCRISGCGTGVGCGSPVDGAAAHISKGYAAGKDTLACPGCAALGIAAEWQEHTGALFLTPARAAAAPLPAAAYAAAAVHITFATDSDRLAPRTVSWGYGAGLFSEAANRFYRYNSCGVEGCSWAAAAAACGNLTAAGGGRGYLATIADGSEAAEALRFAGGGAWTGARAASGFWSWAGGDLAGAAVAYGNWLPGEPSFSSGAAAYMTQPDGRWLAIDALSTAGKGYLCEWEASSIPQCETGAYNVALAAAGCQAVRCPHAEEPGCAADAACEWADAGCQVKACAQFPTEIACWSREGCSWSVASSPGLCVREPCRGVGTRELCEGAPDAFCSWNATAETCSPGSCAARDPCECNSRPECFASTAEDPSPCVDAAYALCPAMDIVVAFSGASGLARVFGRRPHGFYAVLSMLGDWVAGLPLGEERLRVALLQFAGTGGLGAARSAPFGVGGGGALAAVAGGLLAEVGWHADNLLGGASFAARGFAAAADAFEPATSERKNVLVVIGYGSLEDPDASTEQLRRLDAVSAVRLCVALHRGVGAGSVAERDTWQPVASSSALQSATLEQLPLALASICDPTKPFGQVLLLLGGQTPGNRPCPFYGGEEACEFDARCAWSFASRGCAASACVLHCAPGDCEAAACAWNAERQACQRAPGEPPATCSAIPTPEQCAAAALACEWDGRSETCRDPITSCSELATEAACSEQPVCRWDGGVCKAHPCGYADEAACDGDPGCAWDRDAVVCGVVPAICADRTTESACRKGAGDRCRFSNGVCEVNAAHGACSGGGCCVCKAGWTGAQCETCAFGAAPGGECGCTRASTCSGHGFCTPASGVCVCDSGWGGAACGARYCAPRGPVWYTAYPNAPVPGRPFTIVVHGCFSIDASAGSVKVIDGEADCRGDVCAADGGEAVLQGGCAGGVLVESPRVENSGQELLVGVITEAGTNRSLKVCGYNEELRVHTELQTNERYGGSTVYFNVSSSGPDTGAVGAAAAVFDECYDGLAMGDVRIPLAVVCVFAVLAVAAAIAGTARLKMGRAQLRQLEASKAEDVHFLEGDDDDDQLFSESSLFSPSQLNASRSLLSQSQLNTSLLQQ